MSEQKMFPDDPNLTEFYRKHLLSETWKAKRSEVRKRSEGRCEHYWGTKRCPHPATEVHHLDYFTVGNERLSSLKHMCRDCHQWVEAEKRADRKMRAVCTFAEKKHGINWPDMWDYTEVENEFDEWKERNGGWVA